jgi:hypothetical protein
MAEGVLLELVLERLERALAREGGAGEECADVEHGG